MSLTTQYQTGTFTRRIAELRSQSIVEIRFSNQDIGEVVAISPEISANSVEINSGRATYNGRLVCTVAYTDEEGKLCRVQKGAEFSHYCDDDNLAPAHRGIISLNCEKAQIKRDGSSFLVAVVVGADIQVFAPAERSYLSQAEGAVVKSENVNLCTAITFSGESEVEDEFDCNAEDVLVPAAEAIVLDCNAHAGVVEVNGEIYLTMLAMREGAPVSLDRVIPFRCELSCEEALLSRKAFCRAQIIEINVNAKVNEDKGVCGVEIAARLGFSGSFYEEEETPVLADAFSCENNLNLSFAEENSYPCAGYKVYSERVSGLCATKAKLDYTCSFLATATPRAEFAKTESGVEGSVTAALIYTQGGEVHSTEVNLPFAVTLSGLGSADVSIAVCGVSVRQRAEGECEAEAVLKISAAERAERKAKYIVEATEGEKAQISDSAVSVYIPCKGDGLWETAKKLKRAPEDIQSTNPELTFPLSGKERIIVYRSLSN